MPRVLFSLKPPANHLKADVTMIQTGYRFSRRHVAHQSQPACHCYQNPALRHQLPRRNLLMTYWIDDCITNRFLYRSSASWFKSWSGGIASKQCPKLFNRKTGIFHNASHSERLDRIMAWDGQKPFPVTHDDVFTLPDYPKTGFFKGAYCVKMVNSWKFRHD